MLDDAKRAVLEEVLGGKVWSGGNVARRDVAAERFASTLAWSYWPTGRNDLRPANKYAESAAMAPRTFRGLMQRMLGVPDRIRMGPPAKAKAKRSPVARRTSGRSHRREARRKGYARREKRPQ